MDDFRFRGELWQWDAQTAAAWFFVTVPPDLAEDIRMAAGPPRGFGSVRVEATLGGTTWRTSLFPQAESGAFVLPVKKAVRRAEAIDEGDECEISLDLVPE